LALAQAGIGHVVASLGTALTLAQLQVLKRFTRNVIAFFDGDAAGRAAAEKSLPTFFEAGLWGHAAFLPGGDDPDTFVRRAGPDAALALLARATPLLEFYLDRAVSPTSTPAERAQVAQRVAGWLGKIGDPFEYDITVRRAAERLGLGEEMLRRQPARQSGRAATPSTTKAPGPEAMLVELMLASPAAVARVEAGDGVALFTDPLLRGLAEEIVAIAHRGDPVDPATLLSRLDDATAARIAGRLLEEASEQDADREATVGKLVDDCLAKLRADATLPVRQALLRRIRAAEMEGDVAAVVEAQRELDAVHVVAVPSHVKRSAAY
jgi:DNA primase